MKTEKIFSIAVFILSIIFSIAFVIFNDYFKGAISLGLLGLFILNFVSSATLFVSAPSIFAVIAGGAIYSPILVALVSSLGSASGDMLGFILGISGRKILNHKLHKKLWFKVLSGSFEKYGKYIIIILAFIPNPLFDSIGIIAGVFKFSPVKFFLLVFIGRLVRYYMLARFGSIF